MIFEVTYNPKVLSEDVASISKIWRLRIQQVIETKLAIAPEVYGKPLRKSLAGYRTLRVGDYRIIFILKKKLVKVVIIGHRSKIYEKVIGRLQF